jgi:endonuclease YncB( thermonuclease family)
MVVAAVTSAATAAQVPPRAEPALVRYVVDGDTIDVAGLGRVRLLGIDAPEIGRQGDSSEPFADAARDRLSSLLARRWVRLEFELERRDRYDRSLAYVFLESGTFVNALLAREGLARIAAGQPLKRLGELQRAEAEAKAMRRGMWRLGPGR